VQGEIHIMPTAQRGQAAIDIAASPELVTTSSPT
jgi:hypothetical protein